MGNTGHNIDDATMVQSVAAHLTLRSLDEGTEYPLSGAEILIGREVECQIPLRAGHVSRYHAKITLINQAAYIEDLQSTNGTYINGKRVVGRQPIGIGDDIRFHDQHFRLASADSGDADATLVTSFGEVGEDTQPRIQQQPPITQAATPPPTPDSKTIEAPAQPDIAPPRPIKERRASSRPAQKSFDEHEGDKTSLLSMHELQSLAERSSKSQANVSIGNGPRFVILTAPIRGKVFPLMQDAPIGRQWDIGRSQDVDISLEDKTISHHHAKVINTPNGWLISTASAKNGVMVNGLSVTRAFLSHNDRIRLGRIELAFMTDEGEPPAESIYDLPQDEGYNKGLIATAGLSALVVVTLVVALAIQ